MYILIRILIILTLYNLAIEDYKTNTVSSYNLGIVAFLQFLSLIINVANQETEGLRARVVVALILLFVYFVFNKARNWVGEGDIIFLALQLISLNLNDFILFWFSHLFIALILGIFIKKCYNKNIPMFPAYFVAEFFIILRSFL